MLTENSLVDSNDIPYTPPPVSCEKTNPAKSSHSISHESSNLATESCEKYVTSQIPNSLLDGCYDESAKASQFKEFGSAISLRKIHLFAKNKCHGTIK